MKVYLVTHTRNDEELDGFKIIGIFSTVEKAEQAINGLKQRSGFVDLPHKFNIGAYEVDKTFWVDGFG